MLDGEIVLARNGALDFDALQLPTPSRSFTRQILSEQMPASIVFFDLLVEGEHDLRTTPFEKRRKKLESLLKRAESPIHLTPATSDLAIATDWFRRFEGAGLDGVVAKPAAGTYESNKRVMLKVKHERDCDCVVAGFRWHKKGTALRSARCCWDCLMMQVTYIT